LQPDRKEKDSHYSLPATQKKVEKEFGGLRKGTYLCTPERNERKGAYAER
jgi:hypothetical protein